MSYKNTNINRLRRINSFFYISENATKIAFFIVKV